MDNVDDGIKKANEILEEISADKHERYLAHLRKKYILDMNNIESTGFSRGLEQGKIEANNKVKEVAKELKKQKIDISIIEKCTGLSKEEIEKL